MRKYSRWKALVGAVSSAIALAAICSVSVAGAQVQGPQEWDGHGTTQCEPATHLTYYDPRNSGQVVANPDRPNGDNVYYVDPNVLADFRTDGDYAGHPPTHGCDGTPVLRTSAYVAITVQGELWLPDKHVGFPQCSTNPGNTRNPGCDEGRTGVYGGVYVASGDNAVGAGESGGVANPFSEDPGSNLP